MRSPPAGGHGLTAARGVRTSGTVHWCSRTSARPTAPTSTASACWRHAPWRPATPSASAPCAAASSRPTRPRRVPAAARTGAGTDLPSGLIDRRPAGFGWRLLAVAADAVLLALGSVVPFAPLLATLLPWSATCSPPTPCPRACRSSPSLAGACAALWLVYAFYYVVHGWARRGGTPGMTLCGLRLLDWRQRAPDRLRPGVPPAGGVRRDGPHARARLPPRRRPQGPQEPARSPRGHDGGPPPPGWRGSAARVESPRERNPAGVCRYRPGGQARSSRSWPSSRSSRGP